VTQTSLPMAPHTDGPDGRRGSVTQGLGATALALGGSLVLGGLTSFAQTVLPDALRPFANSASGWTMLAFPLVFLTRARLVLGTVLGVVALVGLVEGYAIVSNLRGFYYSYTGIFAVIGLVAGPVLGFAAALTRHSLGSTHRRLWRILGVTPLSAVLIGDGVFGLRYVSETTGTIYWIAAMILGVGFLVLANLRQRPGPVNTAVSVVVTALGALAFLAAYSSISS
jgi:hypothetical protein